MRVLVKELPDKPHADAGKVLDLPEAEAKDMITRGTAVAAPVAETQPDEPPAELSGGAEPTPEPELSEVAAPEPAPEPEPAPKAEPKKTRGSSKKRRG